MKELYTPKHTLNWFSLHVKAEPNDIAYSFKRWVHTEDKYLVVGISKGQPVRALYIGEAKDCKVHANMLSLPVPDFIDIEATTSIAVYLTSIDPQKLLEQLTTVYPKPYDYPVETEEKSS